MKTEHRYSNIEATWHLQSSKSEKTKNGYERQEIWDGHFTDTYIVFCDRVFTFIQVSKIQNQCSILLFIWNEEESKLLWLRAIAVQSHQLTHPVSVKNFLSFVFELVDLLPELVVLTLSNITLLLGSQF